MTASGVDARTENPALFQAAEAVTSQALGRPVAFASAERLTGPGGDTVLYRCTDAASGAAGTFIIKTATGERRGFHHDWSGAEFLSALDQDEPLGPRFYGGDAALGFFVLEDLGEHRSLVGPLLDGDALSAEAGLLKYAASLGRLHAATAGRAAAFEALFSTRFAGQRPYAEELDELEPRLKQVQALLDHLGVRASSALAAEFERVANAAARPGPFLAYLHGDPCPDNLFDVGDRFRLIDFEWGHFGHALLDAVYPRMLWPSCWCAARLPPDTLARVEQRYRSELARGCPEAQDDAVWAAAMMHMCALTLLNRLGWDLETGLTADRKRGRATIRQRTLAQLEAFIDLSEALHQLPALRGAAADLRAVLQARWPETTPMPVYPAFEHRPAGQGVNAN